MPGKGDWWTRSTGNVDNVVFVVGGAFHSNYAIDRTYKLFLASDAGHMH